MTVPTGPADQSDGAGEERVGLGLGRPPAVVAEALRAQEIPLEEVLLLGLVLCLSMAWSFTDDWGEYFALLFWSTVGMMLLTAAEELRFERFNRAGEELLGVASSELLGKNDYDMFPKEQADFFTARDREVLEECFEESEAADCMIVAGTSATVYPAAQFPISIQQRGGDLLEVNPYESEITSLCRLALRGPAGELLPQVAERVRARV